jgi:hypothetical protein
MERVTARGEVNGIAHTTTPVSPRKDANYFKRTTAAGVMAAEVAGEWRLTMKFDYGSDDDTRSA